MKFVLTLIVIIGVFLGGMYLYKKYYKKETKSVKPIPEQVVADQTKATNSTASAKATEKANSTGVTHEKLSGSFKKSGSSNKTPESETLIRADTPIKHSRWGKKIDSIYKKHNTALEKAAGDGK